MSGEPAQPMMIAVTPNPAAQTLRDEAVQCIETLLLGNVDRGLEQAVLALATALDQRDDHTIAACQRLVEVALEVHSHAFPRV